MIPTLKVFCIVLVLSVHPTVTIVNKRKNSSSQYSPHFYPRREYIKKKSYLEADRPLWVLEDKVTRPGEINIATHRPFKPSKRRFISPTTFSPKLPSHYVNLETATVGNPAPQSLPRNHKRPQNHRPFPVFDDFEMDSADPILIYRGPKAEMIFNTMMTSRQYPMKEPVPGQVMYPPYSPKFKPTPVMERSRERERVFHNVTLIPFYAHEAIDPRQAHYGSTSQYLSDSSEEAEDNVLDSQNYLTDEEDREAACYHSYYTQADVQSKYWSMPYSTPSPPADTTRMTLNRQIPVPNGIYSNHRMVTTTPMPSTSDDTPFRILYDSEDENPQRKRYKSIHTAKYGGFKTIYPIYTLNKLLKYKPQKQLQAPLKRSVDIPEKKRKPPPEETWLIWDSSETPLQAVKQIPLGYFRTYTYQPVGAPAPYTFSILGTAANPYTWPTKVQPPPMLPGSRYELYPLPTSTEQSRPPPSTTSTTTTTTTSTAPPSPPPPPPSTQPPLQAQDRMATPLINAANSINIASKYYDQMGAYSQYQGGIYNRRSLPYYQPQSNFYRPYPYPDYSTSSGRSTVQFVPCMCPISVVSPSSDLTERRTMPEGDEIVLLESTDNPNESANTADNIVELEEDAEKKSIH